LEDTETKRRVVVYTSGNWDLFHIGHLNFLERAKKLGDFLVVGVGTDESVVECRGRSPIIPFEQRCQIIRALRCVDWVVPFVSKIRSIETIIACGATIRAIRPSHSEMQLEIKSELEKRGVKHVIIPRTPNISSTKIKEKCYEKVVCTHNCVGIGNSGVQGSEA